jgi:hypothetical protein
MLTSLHFAAGRTLTAQARAAANLDFTSSGAQRRITLPLRTLPTLAGLVVHASANRQFATISLATALIRRSRTGDLSMFLRVRSYTPRSTAPPAFNWYGFVTFLLVKSIRVKYFGIFYITSKDKVEAC